MTPCTLQSHDAMKTKKHRGSMSHVFLMAGRNGTTEPETDKCLPKYDEKRLKEEEREREIKITACEMEIKASGMLKRERKERERGGG